MSTRLDELPGSEMETPQYQQMQMQQTQPAQMQPVQTQPTQMQVQQITEPNSNVSMNIKKRVHFEDEDEDKDDQDFLTYIRSQISEENLLLLFLLIVASRTEFDGYLGSFVGDSSILVTITKGVVLLLIYIISKQFLLPKLKM
jgi:hypothetical protein